MLEELGGHVLVGWPSARQLQGNGQHVKAVRSHPGCAVGLLDVPAGGQRRAAVEDADVVQAQETTLEDIMAVMVFAVHPPGEVQQQFVEDPLQEGGIGLAGDIAGDLVHLPGGPGVHRRVHIAESPLVGGELAVGVHVPFPQK